MRTLHHRDGHHGWDRSLPPLATVAPGEVIELELADCFGGQLGARAVAADLLALDLDRANPLTGPIAVAGAVPGDALGVEVVALEVADGGWTALLPGFGLLADVFDTPHLVRSEVTPDAVLFGTVARLPRAPFLGTVGVAPAAPGPHSVIPPRRVGGNLDCRDVAPGAVLWLPVEVPGGLLSVGDAHAAQGDGEVCGTAVEAAARVTLRLQLVPGAAPASPWLDLPAGRARTPVPSGRRQVTTGVGPELLTGAREATLAMIEHLGRVAGLTPEDAYALCSVAGDLRIVEVVDAPAWVVAMDLDLGVLG